MAESLDDWQLVPDDAFEPHFSGDHSTEEVSPPTPAISSDYVIVRPDAEWEILDEEDTGIRDPTTPKARETPGSDMISTEADENVSRNAGGRDQKQEVIKLSRKPTHLKLALHKAVNAVLFDNGQLHGAAIEAYQESVEHLKDAIVRCATDTDKRKLTTIRDTYRNRIAELRELTKDSADY